MRAAIACGRISAGADGRIPDAAQADAQWSASTLADHVPTAPAAAQAAPSRLAQLRELRAELAIQRETFELDQLMGRYVLVADARADVEQAYSLVKARLLRVPSDLAQRGVAPDVAALVDELIRHALEELAAPAALTEPTP